MPAVWLSAELEAKVGPVLERLVPMLKLQLFDSVDVFAVLERLIRGTAYEDGLQGAAEAMRDLRFSIALERLRTWSGAEWWFLSEQRSEA